MVGWEIDRKGRLHHTGSALFGESGECRGIGLGTWLEVPIPPVAFSVENQEALERTEAWLVGAPSVVWFYRDASEAG